VDIDAQAAVATPGEWLVRRLAVANGPKIFQMLLVLLYWAALLSTASISTWFVSLLFARGDTVMPGGLHARLFHAFLVIVALRPELSQATSLAKEPTT